MDELPRHVKEYRIGNQNKCLLLGEYLTDKGFSHMLIIAGGGAGELARVPSKGAIEDITCGQLLCGRHVSEYDRENRQGYYVLCVFSGTRLEEVINEYES